MQTIINKFYCDVAVIGGGTAGASAAYSASRNGMRTILLERGTSLGGLATNGYVPQVAGMIEGNSKEFVRRLNQQGFLRWRSPTDDHNPTFDPVFAKFTLEQMVMENGTRIIYDATFIDVDMEGNRIKRAIFYTKGGWVAVYADIFIDATGDGDASVAAGVPYELGGADFCGLNMSTTQGSRWAHVNIAKLQEASEKWNMEQAKKKVAKPVSLYYACEEKAIAAGDLTRHFTLAIAPNGIFHVRLPNNPDEDAEFCSFAFHSYYTNNADVVNISRQIVEQHQQMQMVRKFLRKYVPGCENIELVGIGSVPGVRDGRRIFGEYMLKAEDIANGQKFADGIARFPDVLDTHHPTSSTKIFQNHIHSLEPKGTAVYRESPYTYDYEMHPFVRPVGYEVCPSPRDYCDIPYGTIVPKGVDNLLTAGRCCSAEFHACGAMRIICPAMGTGQAAGVAAFLSVTRKIIPRELDGRDVRKFMIEHEGVELDQKPGGWWQARREMKGRLEFNERGTVSIVED